MDIATLIIACAPFVAPNTLMSIMQVESAANPWAINVNNGHRFNKASNYVSAVNEAKRLIVKGANIDMGLMQINSKTMQGLGLTVDQVFDPCTNIYAGATVLFRNYVNASKNIRDDQAALQAAISAYNTGNFKSGFKNGYVRKIIKKANS